MALTPGSRLGVYDVIAQIGAGGMGQVFRARDRTLNRDVALKVLPDSFAQDADRLARFTREAQTLAALNHVNIAAIYGLEESGGVRALVMELVEGEDLSERIARSAIPVDEALAIARQIADALEAAHEQGIIHRDLKPANIKVRPDGMVKVLDFGLAKALDPAPASSAEAMNSPTLTTPAHLRQGYGAAGTEAGMILGTAAYMSPEQARGRVVDRRADIWAFGCVLFEMLTGQRAFAGDDVTEVLASVLAREPEWVLLPAALPPGLGTYVRRCLQKDPRQRVQSVGDVRLALEGAFETAVAPVRPGTAPPGRRLVWLAAVAVGAAVFVALAVPALRHLRERPPPESPVTRFTWVLPDGVTATSAPRISPDGRRVVIAGGGALFVRPLDALEAQRVPDTDGAQAPFWSPDSKSVGFFAGGKLKRVDLTGGPVVTICEGIGDAGGSWSRTGVIVFAPNINSGLQQVPAAGGTPVPATVLDPAMQAASHRWPQFLPDGEHFLYLSIGAPASTGIFVASLGSPAGSLLLSTTARAEYAHPGALLFQRGTTLMHQPFDAGGLRLTGDPVPLVEGMGLPALNDAAFSVSTTGVLTYATGQATLNRRLVWVDRRGAVTPLPLAPGIYSSPALSPDGRQVVLILRDPTGAHLWVYDIARGTLSKRTFEGGDDTFPIWTPDGAFLTFTKGPLMRLRADGSGAAEPLVTDAQLAGLKIATSWSIDERFLAIQSGSDVVVRDRDGVFHSTLTSSAYEREGRFAPNGRWLAYRSDESGRDQVYVQSYPPGLGKWQISTDGGAQPMWAPNGRELFYKNGNRMMVVDVELGAAFAASAPRMLFEMPLPESTPGDPSRYGVAPDGRRFLVLTTAAADPAASAQPVTVVLNWAQALTRLVPATN